MSESIQQMADKVIQGVKQYVQRHAIDRTEELERRVVELEERLRAIDGQKANIGNARRAGYLTKDLASTPDRSRSW